MALSEPIWSGSEEDPALRSHVIQWLLHHAPVERPAIAAGAKPIPRVVVQYWHDSAALPADVALCLHSWNRLTDDGFVRQVFDDVRARRFIAASYDAAHVTAFDRCYHPAMRCDYFRLCYLLSRGGFYVDADEVYRGTGCESLFQDERLKLQPLCYDTSSHRMVPPEDFLGDITYPSSRIFYVNNNPIVAPPGHPLIDLALRRATDLLLRAGERPEIQATTGPGNLTASLVRHVMQLQQRRERRDFAILRNWTSISDCSWQLSYRSDARNWRLANATGRA